MTTTYAGWTMSNTQAASNWIRQLQADIQRMTAELETADEGARKVLLVNLKTAQKRLAKELRAQRREDESNYADQEDLAAFARGR